MSNASYGKGINKVWNKVRWIMGNNMTDFLQHSSTAQQHNRDNITEFTAKRDGDYEGGGGLSQLSQII